MQEEVLGPKYSVRLGDLRPWHVLKVTCLRCRRAAVVSPAPLVARFGEHAWLVRVEERFACTECGNRAGNSAKVLRLER
jgi:hypothetical protein